ncbi:MAG: oligopeptide:H+ symporter [Planctomycetota bacterium]|jgi:POT family proton-dependent oligopeptide transporter
MNNNQMPMGSRTLFGHPTGLFTLFFAEMWERFSYYGMRALLILYMIKGFLSYGDNDAYTVYGAYTALVYMTPFFGGMLADRLLGQRRAVVLGGLLMAAGHLVMAVEHSLGFFTALALLICGNGFFKPNISTIVGSLYPQGSPRRDGGFTIFYMGINLGATMSPLLCGYIGETYGWHYGFGLATIGMLTGVAVFVAPTLLTQILIMSGAGAAAVGMFCFHADDPFSTAINVGTGIVLLIAGVISLVALGRGGLPAEAGGPPDSKRLRRRVAGLIPVEYVAYLGTALAIPLFMLLVSGFAPLTANKRPISIFPEQVVNGLTSSKTMRQQLEALRKEAKAESNAGIDDLVKRFEDLHEKAGLTDAQHAALGEAIELARTGQWDEAQTRTEELKRRFPIQTARVILSVVLEEVSRPAGLVLFLSGLIALVYLGVEMIQLDWVARQRMYVVLILTFFSMLFWAFFEQAGSSVNNFTDRNVDRVSEAENLAQASVGTTIEFRVLPDPDDEDLKKLPLLSQEQLGRRIGGQTFKARIEQAIRSEEKRKEKLKPEQIDRLVETVNREDALTLTALTYLRAAAGREDAPPEAKTVEWVVSEENVGMGVGGSEIPASVFQAANPMFILVFGLIFTALWAFLARRRLEPSTPVKFALGLAQLGLGFVAFWYGAHTADERGMVLVGWLLLGYLFQTTGELCLSPVGLSMITKLSPARLVSTVMGVWFLATAFSQLLAAIIAQFTGVTDGGDGIIPVPKETVGIYGNVYGWIAIAAVLSALVCLALAPLLSYWMHADKDLREGAEEAEEGKAEQS